MTAVLYLFGQSTVAKHLHSDWFVRIYYVSLNVIYYFLEIHVLHYLYWAPLLKNIYFLTTLPYLGSLREMGVWPPSNLTCTPPPCLALLPLWPLPEVLLSKLYVTLFRNLVPYQLKAALFWRLDYYANSLCWMATWLLLELGQKVI